MAFIIPAQRRRRRPAVLLDADAQSLGGGRSWPMTFSFGRRGKQVHADRRLRDGRPVDADIKRFALAVRT